MRPPRTSGRIPGRPSSVSSGSGPLSAADREQLTDLLTHTTWDMHGLLGIFSAVAIAPRDIGFGELMLVIAPRPKGLMAFERAEDAEDFLPLVDGQKPPLPS